MREMYHARYKTKMAARYKERYASDPEFRIRRREIQSEYGKRRRAKNRPEADTPPPCGIVYFVQESASGFVKIGYTSKSVEQRMSTLRCANPHQLTLLAAIPGSIRAEVRLHARFETAHHFREWFHPVPELLAYIDEISAKRKPAS